MRKRRQTLVSMSGSMAFRPRIHRRVIFLLVLLIIAIYRFCILNFSDIPCSIKSPMLIGWTNISLVVTPVANDIPYTGRSLEIGGSYRTAECRPKHNMAVIVPYRNRSLQLDIFLNYIHPFLQRQQLDYTIFVVEQAGSLAFPFNRGMLMNIGFSEALHHSKFDCFVFHDVDLLPEDDRNSYSCPEEGFPRHLSVAINTFGYRPIGQNHFGGVSSLTTADFVSVNGFSNSFWGWGGEDDDLFERLRSKNFTIRRHRPLRETRYTMLQHGPAVPNPERKRIFQKNKADPSAMLADGLTSLKYRVIDIQLKYLYTHILVDIRQ